MKRFLAYKIIILLLFIQVICVNILARYPEFVERYYSSKIYPAISKIFRLLFGWIPFSVGDIFYFLFAIFILLSAYKLFKKGLFKNIVPKLYKIGAFLSIFYFLFHFLWGMNYYRNSLFKTLNLTKEKYSNEELFDLSEELLNKTKQIHLKITKNDSAKVVISDTKSKILEKAELGYKNLQEKHSEFTYNNVSLKKSLYSLPLTYMGFSGYLNPFFGEAQVNYLPPKHNLPVVATHEIAHQIGYASESEANFIGFLAATHNSENYYKYSAYLKAFRYAITAAHGKDSTRAKAIIDKIPYGIKLNIKDSENFWVSYENKTNAFFDIFYDAFLKANNQKDGMKSYSKMVGLLVAYRKKHEL